MNLLSLSLHLDALNAPSSRELLSKKCQFLFLLLLLLLLGVSPSQNAFQRMQLLFFFPPLGYFAVCSRFNTHFSLGIYEVVTIERERKKNCLSILVSVSGASADVR